MTYVISVPVKPIRLKLIGDLSWLANKYIQLLKLTNISEFCSHRKGGLCFQCSAAFSAVMVGEVNKQILVLSFRLSNISILDHSQPCLLRNLFILIWVFLTDNCWSARWGEEGICGWASSWLQTWRRQGFILTWGHWIYITSNWEHKYMRDVRQSSPFPGTL